MLFPLVSNCFFGRFISNLQKRDLVSSLMKFDIVVSIVEVLRLGLSSSPCPL